jgi:hypothetical protein
LSTVLDKYPEALDQHGVPINPALWKLESYEDFLGERRERLAMAINGFMDGLLAETQKAKFTIADYISAGESDTVEFNMALRWDFQQSMVNKALEKVAARTVAAFMNRNGGTLVIGVSDEGQIVGLDADYATLGTRKNSDGWEQGLRNVLNTYLSEEVAALVGCTFSQAEGKTVAVLRADPAHRPIYLFDGNAAEFYVRSGNTTQQLDVKQANGYSIPLCLSCIDLPTQSNHSSPGGLSRGGESGGFHRHPVLLGSSPLPSSAFHPPKTASGAPSLPFRITVETEAVIGLPGGTPETG